MEKRSFLDEVALSLQADEAKYYSDQKVSSNFWTIKTACDTIETGHNFPQIKKILGGVYQFDKPNSVRKISYDKIPDDDFIDFGVLQMHTSSKLSDTISSGGPGAHGFYLNSKGKEIFSRFNLGEHRYYPVEIEHKKQLYKYYFLQIKNNFNSFIDFDNSTFYVQTGMINGPREIIKLKTADEISRLIDKLFSEWKAGAEYKEVGYKNIQLKKNLPQIDIFTFSRLGVEKFITKNLKVAIEEERLTGLRIDEQRKVDLE